MNVDYVYAWDKERYEKVGNKKLKWRDKLNAVEVEDGYLLPAKPHKGMIFGAGGVLDSKRCPVKESYIYTNANLIENEDEKKFTIQMGGTYEFENDDANVIKGEVIYLGFILNHWGHFLVDFTTRFWYPLKYGAGDMKLVFLIKYGQENFSLIEPIARFISLLGIDVNNIIFVNKICKVSKIVVPEQAYLANMYASNEYVNIFNIVRLNAKKKFYNHSEKIYFTRTKFKSAANKEVGEELLVDIFRENGFEIVSPEEYTLDEQIYMVQNAKILAGVSGTSLHNLLFSEQHKKCIVINKSNIINITQIDINKIRGVEGIYVDGYACLFPVSMGFGPFLFIMNDNVKKFTRDNDYKLKNKEYGDELYVKAKIREYMLLFKSINKNKIDSKQLNYNADPNSVFYFSSEFLRDWMRKYYLMSADVFEESGKLNNGLIAENVHFEVEDLICLRENDLGRPFLCIEAHFSHVGWIPTRWEKQIVGNVSKDEQLEALRVYLSTPKFDVFYSVYVEDKGWCKLAKDGDLVGSVGKSCPVLGVKFQLDTKKQEAYDIYYRLHDVSSKWSKWNKNGEEIYGEKINALQVFIREKEQQA